MTKALALFHFNIQYVAGDVGGYHRYCQEAIRPFILALARNKGWRVSFEASGSGLEFLDRYYPSIVQQLRHLTESGQVELISATYAPTIWPAFPKRDLVASVQLNRKVLDRLRLNAAPIFFAQEAFFGPGIEVIGDLFAAAVCKDDYLSYLSGLRTLPHAFHLNGMPIIVGSNHLLIELYRRLMALPVNSQPKYSAAHRRLLTNSIKDKNPIPPSLSTEPASQWYWYHMGSGHHFANCAPPGDWDNFFADTEWIRMTEDLLESYSLRGWAFATLMELVNNLDVTRLSQMPYVIEGGWNPTKSSGVYQWMGRHVSPWENDASTLGLSWRSRAALVRCEECIKRQAGLNDRAAYLEQLEDIWKIQILAESSDSLGWAPLQAEVQYSRSQAESVLNSVAAIDESIGYDEDLYSSDYAESVCAEPPTTRESMCDASLFGGTGHLDVSTVRPDLNVVDVELVAGAYACGIRFPVDMMSLMYSPSGLEHTVLPLALEKLVPETIYLPLANGLLTIGANTHIIRVNSYGMVAACIERQRCAVSFGIEGAIPGRRIKWRFLLLRGSVDVAVQLAGRVNSI